MGGIVKVTLDYFTVLPGLDLKVPFILKFNPQGISSVTGTFTENADSISLGLDFTFVQKYQFGLITRPLSGLLRTIVRQIEILSD